MVDTENTYLLLKGYGRLSEEIWKTQVRFPADLAEEIRDAADGSGQSVNKWLEDAARAYIKASRKLREARLALVAEEQETGYTPGSHNPKKRVRKK